MKTIHVDFYKRVMLWDRIGTAQAPNIKAVEVLVRIIARLRPTDEERKTLKFRATPDGRYQWHAPEGLRNAVYDIDIEDEEAEMLKTALENHPYPIQVSDGEWMLQILDAIKPEPEAKDAAAAA